METPERGRAARLRLTDHGRELLRAAAAGVHRLDEAWTPEGLDPEELRAALRDAVRRLGEPGRTPRDVDG